MDMKEINDICRVSIKNARFLDKVGYLPLDCSKRAKEIKYFRRIIKRSPILKEMAIIQSNGMKANLELADKVYEEMKKKI